VLRVRTTSVISNTAASGGGACSQSDGVLEVEGSAIAGNRATLGGGGLLASASAIISRSVIADNESAGIGGGLLISNAVTILSDSTVSRNAAAGDGGGAWNAGVLRARSSTLADNVGLGLYHHASGSTEAVNTLLAGNTGGNCSGVVFSLGHNLEDGGACGMGQATDLPNTDPLLGALADNGGSTLTHAIGQDSPAVDAGDNASCTSTDQRGRPRADGDGDGTITCDIGALEYVPPLTVHLPLVLRNH
jgi:hypothetical protein